MQLLIRIFLSVGCLFPHLVESSSSPTSLAPTAFPTLLPTSLYPTNTPTTRQPSMVPTKLPSLSPTFPTTYSPSTTPTTSQPTGTPTRASLFFWNLTQICKDQCSHPRCVGCNNPSGLYIRDSNSGCPNPQKCAYFVSRDNRANLYHLYVAYQLSIVVVVLSVITFLFISTLILEQFKHNIEEKLGHVHAGLVFVEAVLSATTFFLLVSGEFSLYLSALASSGCYEREGMKSIVSVAASLATATAIAIITTLVEFMEVFQHFPACFQQQSPGVFFFFLSILAMAASAIELSQLEAVVVFIEQISAQLYNPQAIASPELTGMIPCVWFRNFTYDTPAYGHVHVIETPNITLVDLETLYARY